MSQLDNKGYTPDSPQEILEKLEALIKERIPSFQTFPAELRGNLLQEGAVLLTFFENLVTMYLNYLSPSMANQLFFEFFANERGLRRKGAYKSEVQLQFTGEAGSLISEGTEVSNADGSVVFKTFEEALIGLTGVVLVTGYSDEDRIPPVSVGDINKTVLNIAGLQVTNLSQPTAPVAEESFADFKLRCQASWRNSKDGSYEGLINRIKSLDGVEQRTVSYRNTTTVSEGITYATLEVVVNGGEAVEIARELYKSGLTGKIFLSNPSKSETQRTVTQQLFIYGNPHTYKFTRPKLLPLDIAVTAKFIGIQVSNKSVEVRTQEAIEEYLNSLQVGRSINKTTLIALFLKGLQTAGVNPDVLAGSPVFTITSGGEPVNFNKNEFLELEFDEYVSLNSYKVEVTTIG